MFLSIPLAVTLPSSLEASHELIEGLYAKVAQLEQLARVDGLTCIPNRRAFDERLAASFSHARRTQTPLSVALLDMDHFKRINDVNGHAAGDRTLRLFAEQLKSYIRADDFAARIGGEEFAMILPNTYQVDGAELCRRLARFTRQGCALSGPLTFSCGVAELDATMAHPSTMLDRADRAMYYAKNSGRDRVCIHQSTYSRAGAFLGRIGVR